MPTIGNLVGIGQSSCDRFTIAAAPVSGDDRNGRTFGKPGPRRFQCSIRQKGDRLSALQIANNRAICLAAPECEVINADDMEPFMHINRAPPYYPQKCVLAHRHHETAGKCGSGPSTERETKMVDYRLKTLGTTAISSQDTGIELLAENTAPANDRVAPKTTRRNLEYDAPPR